MKRMLGLFAVAVCMVVAIPRANAASEIVVTIRYLEAKGTSHAHLFLYREDGTLLRQLTARDLSRRGDLERFRDHVTRAPQNGRDSF